MTDQEKIESYDHLSREELIERLLTTENVALNYYWSAERVLGVLTETARKYEGVALRTNSYESAGKAEGISYAVRVMADVLGIDVGAVLERENVKVKV